MMRNSTLLKWAQNNKTNNQPGKNGNRNWIHSPDVLQRGHIAYLVKFLGNTSVDQPKGIEIVKEGIRKLKFTQQLRKAEGNKTPKVELTISIDGVAIQEPKTKRILHQYPLHRISYCADDKGEKRFFSFIAKEGDGEKHMCFVFVSDKLAEEITLTIGQAFDLAYRRFLETSNKDLEAQRKVIVQQQKLKWYEDKTAALEKRLNDVSKMCRKNDIDDYTNSLGLPDLLFFEPLPATADSDSSSPTISSPGSSPDYSSIYQQENGNHGNLLNLSMSSNSSSNGFASPAAPPPVPPRAFESAQPSVGTKLEGLLMDEFDEDFNPRAFESNSVTQQFDPQHNTVDNFFPNTNGNTSPPPLLAPPPKVSRDTTRRTYSQTNGTSDPFKEDMFGSTPFVTSPTPTARGAPVSDDPFGMAEFAGPVNGGDPSQRELTDAIGFLDKRLLEMKAGFSRGLSIGNDDFSLESLDPLRN